MAAPHPPLRSAIVDGSPRGRFEGQALDLEMAPDGAHVVVHHRATDRRAELVTRVSLADGACERLAERPLTRHAPLAGAHDLDAIRAATGLDLPPSAALLDVTPTHLLVADSGDHDARWSVVAVATGAARPVRIEGPRQHPRLTPDGARVAYLRGSLVCLHDVASGRDVDLHDGPDAHVQHLAWSRDGARLATVGYDGAVRVLDVTRGALTWTLEGAPGFSWDGPGNTRLVFAPDGRTLLAVSPGAVLTWSLATGDEVDRSSAPAADRAILAAELSPDGRLLAVLDRDWIGSTPRTVHVFDVAASMGPVAQRPLSFVYDDQGARLRFDAPGRLSLFVRHHQHAGQAALFRFPVAEGPVTIARRSFRKAAQVLPLDDAAALHLDRGALSTADLEGRAGTDPRRAPDGLAFDSLLDARGGVAALRVRDGTSTALALTDLSGERVYGLAHTPRAVLDGLLSPDGRRLAVRYMDGGVEVFEALTAPASPG